LAVSESVGAEAAKAGDFLVRLGIILMAIFCLATLAAVVSFRLHQAACAALTAEGYSPSAAFPDEWVWTRFVPGHMLALATPSPPQVRAVLTWVMLIFAGLLIAPRLMGMRGQPYRRSVLTFLPVLAAVSAVLGLISVPAGEPRNFTLDFDRQSLTLPAYPGRTLPLSTLSGVQIVTHTSTRGRQHISIVIADSAGQSFTLLSDQPAAAAPAIRDVITAALTSNGQEF